MTKVRLKRNQAVWQSCEYEKLQSREAELNMKVTNCIEISSSEAFILARDKGFTREK